jgi:acetyl esterase
VFFHGGGWVFGTIDTHDAACRALANAADATVISVDYRLAPEHPYPAAVDDAEAATEWIVANAAELHIHPDKVAVCGDSAGGNLAAIVAQRFRTLGVPLVAQLLVYPMTDLSDEDSPSLLEFDDGYLLTAAAITWFIDNYVTRPERSEPRCSPAFGDLTGVAPTFVLTAECDPLRSQCEAYAAALVAAGVDTELVQFDGQVHSFFTQVGVLTDAQRAVDSLAAFFRSRL